MEKNEIDAARAQATQVAAVLTPLLTALQSASAVLSLASNAEKQKGALVKEVEGLQSTKEMLQRDLEVLANQKTALTIEVKEAEREAKAAVAAAKSAATAKAKEAEAAATRRAAAAAAAAAEKEAEFTAHIAEVQQKTDAEVAALFTKAETASEAAAAAEKRLAAVQAQAQKLMASIGG